MKSRAGFTMVDLVALLFVAMLLTAVFTGCSRAFIREDARRASCKANLQAIGKALVIYTGDTSNGAFLWFESDNQWSAATGENREKAPSSKTNRNVSALLLHIYIESIVHCIATAKTATLRPCRK